MNPLPILIVLSSAHEVLYREYFQPTLPADTKLVIKDLGVNTDDGSFLSAEWQDAMCAKIRHALEFCNQAEEGQLFIVSDVDVQFFPAFQVRGFIEHFDSLGCDLAFQRERMRPGDTEVNCGFYAGRNSQAVRDLLKASLEYIERENIKNEQVVMNMMMERMGTSFAFLDGRFYGRTHGFPPSKDLWVHHASWTMNIAQKITQLERVRRIVGGGAIRLACEAYREHMERALAKKPNLGGIIHAHQEFISKLPIKPLSLP